MKLKGIDKMEIGLIFLIYKMMNNHNKIYVLQIIGIIYCGFYETRLIDVV